MSQHGYDPERVRTRAVELRESGLSLERVAATLTDEGYNTKRGGPWQATVVWRLLRDDAQTATVVLAETS